MKFSDFLDEHRVHYEISGAGTRPGWIQFQCPWCRGGRDPNKLYMGYHLYLGFANCWRCGPHSAVATAAQIADITIREASRLLGDIEREGVYHPKPQGKLILPKGRGPLLKPHKKYLRGRGFIPRELEQLWGLQGIGIASKFSWRLFIPIRFGGEIVSFTTRHLGEYEPRYVSAGLEEESLPHKDLIYGEEYCRTSIIVVEGPTGVWRIGPGAGGTLGVMFTDAQVEKLSKYPIRAVCFDNEPEAQRRARRLCEQLEPFPGVTYRVVLNASDPGEAQDKEIRELRRRFLE